MSEREFWLVVRSALIMVCNAIERRYLKGDNGGPGGRVIRAQSFTPAPSPQTVTASPAPTFGQPAPE